MRVTCSLHKCNFKDTMIYAFLVFHLMIWYPEKRNVCVWRTRNHLSAVLHLLSEAALWSSSDNSSVSQSEQRSLCNREPLTWEKKICQSKINEIITRLFYMDYKAHATQHSKRWNMHLRFYFKAFLSVGNTYCEHLCIWILHFHDDVWLTRERKQRIKDTNAEISSFLFSMHQAIESYNQFP